jgi:hypothetical protein
MGVQAIAWPAPNQIGINDVVTFFNYYWVREDLKMRLDAKKDRELEKRKGFASRTILAVIWLAICIGSAYFLLDWLFENNYLNTGFFYGQLRIPPDIPDWVIFVGSIAVIVVIVNFLVLIGYAFFSPSGRRRPGTSYMYSADPDPDDRKFDYH